MLPKMKASHFVKKFSVQFVNSEGRESAPFYFHDNKPHECSQTWQVVRSEFDLMMLNNAREHGVNAHEGVRVRDVIMEGDKAVGVMIQEPSGETRNVYAKVVVDASGQTGLLMNKFKMRTWDPVLNKGAIWTYWENAYRDEGKNAGATIVIQTGNKQGWFWYIPLHEGRTSVGVVAPFDYLFDGRGSHEQVYHEEIENCPGVKERLKSAKRIKGYFATRDYSYRCDRVAGDGWVMIGDAFGFLDPLYSSGVLLALKSGEMAADAIVEGFEKNDTSESQLGKWGPELHAGIDRMRRLVCEYYDGFSFGGFIRKHPDLRGKVTDLLIGDLFTDKVDVVWEPLEAMYPEGKRRPGTWKEGTPGEQAAHKRNELTLPEGVT